MVRMTGTGTSRSLMAAPTGCVCASMIPGTTVRPLRSILRVFGPAVASASLSVPTATKRLPRTAKACAAGRESETVMTLPLK